MRTMKAKITKNIRRQCELLVPLISPVEALATMALSLTIRIGVNKTKTKTREGNTTTHKTKTAVDKTDFQDQDTRLPKRRSPRKWS